MTETFDAFHTFEHQGWERAAAHYDEGFGPVTGQAVKPMLDILGVKAGTRLLDVACGPGYVSARAAARGADVIGIDFSTEMVAQAQRRYLKVRFDEGDAEKLRYPDASFDAVAMNFGMLHLAHPDRAIAEAHRVLRTGGRYAFTVWDVPERARGFQIVLDAVQARGNMDVGLPPGPPFFRFSDPQECKKTLEAAGFDEVRSATVPQVWIMESADTLLQTFRKAAVRTAALLNAQTEAALAAIAKEIAQRTEPFRIDGRIELPMPAVLTVGVSGIRALNRSLL